MNQMMGAASTALSDFLGRPVNISTPTSYTLDDLAQFKNDHFRTADGLLVVVRFMLRIENILQSEFVNVMSVDLARELLSGFGMGEDSLSASAAPKTVSAPEQPQQPAAQQAENGSSGGTLSQEEIERLMGGAAPSGQQTPPQTQQNPSGGKLSQEEIERLMGGMAAQQTPPPQAEQNPSGGKLSQEEI